MHDQRGEDRAQDRHEDGRGSSGERRPTHAPSPAQLFFLGFFVGVGFGVAMSPVQVIGLNSWLGR